MRWPKLRRGGDPVDTDSVREAPAEPVQTAAEKDQTTLVGVATAVGESDHDEQPSGAARRIHWSRALVFVVLPALALLLAAAAGFLKWQGGSGSDAAGARVESVRAATDSTIALLSYKPDTVEKDLAAARARLTGTFLSAYTSLTHDVVVPGAKQKQISAVATVPAAASASATENHAVVLLFVNQTVIVGQDAPTNTASSVRVTLDKVGGRWLISQFEPV
jgi:Mce-associated membrane protein